MDQRLVLEALRAMPDPPSVTFVEDGIELLARLQHLCPRLIVLDLKMPRVGGLAALERLQTRPAWAAIPVAIFSSGNQPSEISACLRLGAKEYILKPIAFDDLCEAVARIGQLAKAMPVSTAV